MRAVWIDAYGGIERLHVRSSPDPEMGPRDVLVKVEACGVNFADILQRSGCYLGGPRPPFVPGLEASGTVESIGSEVVKFHAGDRVVGLAGRGMHAERAVILENASYRLPDDVPFDIGAAIPIQYPTAYHILTSLCNAKRDETVLIHAAAGGLGTAAVQIAKLLGLRVVGTSSNLMKRERVRTLGADHVFGYETFENDVRSVTGGRGCDIIVDSIGGSILQRSMTLLPSWGRIVLVGIASKERYMLDPMKLLYRSQSVLGFHFSSLVQRHETLRSTMDTIFDWIRSRRIHVQISDIFALDEVRAAHESLERRQNVGKVVLRVA